MGGGYVSLKEQEHYNFFVINGAFSNMTESH